MRLLAQVGGRTNILQAEGGRMMDQMSAGIQGQKIGHSTLARNTVMPLDLSLVEAIRVNRSAVERRIEALPGGGAR